MLMDDCDAANDILKFKKREFDEYQRQISAAAKPGRHLINSRERLRKQIELDENEIKEYDDSLILMLKVYSLFTNYFKKSCIEGYALAMKHSSKYDLFCSLYPFFSLIF
jgi:hypothetical protein